MFKLAKSIVIAIIVAGLSLSGSAALAESGSREFSVSSGGKLILDLDAGGTVAISGSGGSSVSVNWEMSCRPECEILFDESGDRLKVETRFTGGGKQNSDIDLEILVPSSFDVELDSNGGDFSIDGVDGEFTGKTMGGALTLNDVRGEAELKTMGGEIRLTNSELDGSLKTMGGEVLFENVIGDVKGRSMGGNVRYKNVQRRDGDLGSPARTGDGLKDLDPDTVQISTMGGKIDIEDAPEGADLHTMGGKITVRDAQRFVRAKTMGGDILIDSIDGWVEATTMGGDIEVTVTGGGGDVTLVSMSGDVELYVPSGFGMDVELEIAFTRNSRKEFRIDAPEGLTESVSTDWDHDHGSPRKYIRSSGTINGGGNVVKIETVNGNITLK